MFKSFFSNAIAISLLLLTVNTAFATTQVPSRVIKSISTYSFGVVIEFATTTANGESCAGDIASTFAFLDSTTSGGKQMLASALAARVSDKPMAIGIRGCRAWGSSQLPIIYKAIL